MLCEDCRELIQLADQALSSTGPVSAVKRDVTTSVFKEAIEAKCYLCTRLFIQLGVVKWNRILDVLPKMNVVLFDKSAHCHPPCLILVRLGCKLTPISSRDEEGQLVLGKSHSYGYLQVALLPRDTRWDFQFRTDNVLCHVASSHI